MNLQIFAVRDAKSDQFANPMFIISKGLAIRSFSDAVNETDANNQLNKHPEDFALWHLGEYNTDTGLFQTHTPTQVVLATEVLQKQ